MKRLHEIAENDAFIEWYYQNVYVKEQEEQKLKDSLAAAEQSSSNWNRQYLQIQAEKNPDYTATINQMANNYTQQWQQIQKENETGSLMADRASSAYEAQAALIAAEAARAAADAAAKEKATRDEEMSEGKNVAEQLPYIPSNPSGPNVFAPVSNAATSGTSTYNSSVLSDINNWLVDQWKQITSIVSITSNTVSTELNGPNVFPSVSSAATSGTLNDGVDETYPYENASGPNTFAPVVDDSVNEPYSPKKVLDWLDEQTKGVTTWIKDRYMTIWNNFDAAKEISSNENASFWQRVVARNYMSGVVTIHLVLALGLGILAWEGGAAAYTAVDGVIETVAINSVPTYVNVVDFLLSKPVIGPILTSRVAVKIIGGVWDLGFNAMLLRAHNHGDENAAAILSAVYQMDSQISASEVIAAAKVAEMRAGNAATGINEIAEVFAKNEDNLAKVIIDFRSGKYEGKVGKEAEGYLQYLSDIANTLKLTKAESELLRYSDDIVYLERLIQKQEGAQFEVIGVQTAEEANAFMKEMMDCNNPPVLANTDSYIVKLKTDANFVRVYDNVNSGQPGQWIMRYEDIAGLTPVQIKEKFSLPQIPTMITDVKLKAGDTIRISISSDVYDGTGGMLQFDLIGERIGEFINGRPLTP